MRWRFWRRPERNRNKDAMILKCRRSGLHVARLRRPGISTAANAANWRWWWGKYTVVIDE